MISSNFSVVTENFTKLVQRRVVQFSVSGPEALSNMIGNADFSQQRNAPLSFVLGHSF